jgi:hypothetical protein
VPNQTFAIYAQAKHTTPWLLTYEEADQIAYNKDPAKGHVFEPSRDDYLATVDLGRKDSVNRTQVTRCLCQQHINLRTVIMCVAFTWLECTRLLTTRILLRAMCLSQVGMTIWRLWIWGGRIVSTGPR